MIRTFLGLVLIAGAVLAAYTVTTLSPPALPLTVRIAVSQTPLTTPFYVAQTQGYFEKHGVNVELIPYVGGHDCFKAMIDGEVDLATASDSVVMFNSFTDSQFSVLSSFVESDNDVKIVTAPEAEVHTPVQLRGKKVGVTYNSSSEYFLHTLLLINGIQPQEISMVHLRPEEMVDALRKGQIAAASLWEPFANEASQLAGSQQPVLNARGIYTLSFNLLSQKDRTTPDLESHRRVLAALRDANRFIVRNSAHAQSIIASQLNRSPTDVSRGWSDYLFKLSLSNSLIATLESEARWAISQSRVEKQTIPNYRNYVDNRALASTDKTATLIR